MTSVPRVDVNLHGGSDWVTILLQVAIPAAAVILSAVVTYWFTTRVWTRTRAADVSDQKRTELLEAVTRFFDCGTRAEAVLSEDGPNMAGRPVPVVSALRKTVRAAISDVIQEELRLALFASPDVLKTGRAWFRLIVEDGLEVNRSSGMGQRRFSELDTARSAFVEAVRAELGYSALSIGYPLAKLELPVEPEEEPETA